LIPAFLITFAHFGISALIKAENSAGELPLASRLGERHAKSGDRLLEPGGAALALIEDG
jgi:hypothetical protein